MSGIVDWCDTGSLTPPLCEIEQEWNGVDLDENILNFEEDLEVSSSKRRKTEGSDESKFTPLFDGCTKGDGSANCHTLMRLTAGYIKHGFLSRFLHNTEPEDALFKKPIITLFDWKFISATALVQQRQRLFCLLRQKITEFESEQTDYGQTNCLPKFGENCLSFVHIRKQCSSFLLYVITFIFRNPVVGLLAFGENSDPSIQSWTSFPFNLKKDVDHLWIFLGPINTLPNSSFLKLEETSVSTSQLLTPSAHWLHLHLELKWGVLEILSRLYNSLGRKYVDHLTEIEEKSLALMMDLVHISTHVNISTNKSTLPSSLLNTSPFLCPCVKELWVIMIHYLDFYSTNYATKSFWSNFTSVFLDILQTDKDQRKEFPFDVAQITCKNPVQFCWWLLVHVAQLYWYNDKGEYIANENASVPGNWILVQDLLKLSFLSKEANIQEDVSRCYLSCCLQIVRHWHLDNDIVLLLWHYFQKKMNDTFHVTGQGLQGMACARDMPYQWFEQVLARCNYPQHSNDNESSYLLFLRIVALHVKKLKVTTPLQGWKQLKGRFYSKFHKRRMEELSEQGLLSFFNLFLTLAHVGELEDVSNKMVSFLDLLDFKSLDYGRKLCVWKGYFVLLFLCKHQKTSVEFIVQKVSEMFTEICREYKESQKDKTQRHNCWSFISLYLECTQELLDYENLERISDYKLIDEGFGILFSICGEKELMSLLNFSQSLLDVVSNEIQDQSIPSSALAQALWQRVFPHVRQRILDPFASLTCSSQMANLVVSFTLLSLVIPPAMSSSGKSLETFHNLVKQFGTKDSVTASVCCQFLGTLLASQQALDVIVSSEYRQDIIHTWFRCCLQISSQDDHLRSLTRIVFLKFPDIEDLIKTQRSVAAGNVETALTTFIKSLGDKFSSLELLADTVAFREKALVYVGGVLKYVEVFLKQTGPADFLRLSYKVAAALVRDCPKIIYRKTQHDCLLPQIIDQLILPLNAKKPLPPSITQCIKLNLTEFLEGLASLDFRRDEFIKRKIKQIFATYFQAFNQKCYGSATSSTPIKNPFLDVLRGTLTTNPSQDASDFRQHVMRIIKDKYLVIPGLTPQQLTPTLLFLVNLFSRTVSPRETARNTPLIIKNVLGCLLACDTSNPGNEPPHIRKEASTILRLMLESCQKAHDVTPRDLLLPLLREFMISNISQVQGMIFKVFTTMAAFDRELVLALIPCSKQTILENERKRGVGNDTRLRASFKTLLESLGESGKKHLEDFS